MKSTLPIGRLVWSPSGSTGGGESSFERELRRIVWRRGRLAMLLGVAIGATMFTLSQLIFRFPPPVDSPLAFLHPEAFSAYPAVFAVGAALLWRDRWSAWQVQGIILGVLALMATFDAGLTAVLYPDESRFFSAALFLFVAAAIVPWRLGFQAALGVVVVAVYPAALAAARGAIPAVDAYWESLPGFAWRNVMVNETIATAVLAAVSLAITRTLYHMRRQLHEAKRLGNYVIEREIGGGGMGTVYEARHALIRRPTAVKVVRSGVAGSDDPALARFEREVQLSATLRHPNTITIFDFGRVEDTFYYAMEYLEGLDLERLVDRHGALPARRVVHLLRQACGSLAEAHERGIVHRDIKPSNVFVTRLGGVHDFVKVLDFGLAKEIHAPPAGLTQANTVLGTPRYMPPEAVIGPTSLDHRSDVYCLGCVLYFVLTGHPPFPAATGMQAIVEHVRSEPRAPSREAELDVPEELDRVVLRCLAKDPEERFQSMAELDEGLQAVPLEPWTPAEARAWWELHMGERSVPEVAETGG